MKRTLTAPERAHWPIQLRALSSGCPVYDSSCSPGAQVLYIERDGGYYLKSAPKGELAQEARMTAYFYAKGLGPEALQYLSEERDWLLTRRVPGEDCTHAAYLSEPKRLCDALAASLRRLHELDAGDCPVQDKTAAYREMVQRRYASGQYDTSHFPDSFGYTSAQEAWSVVERYGGLLRHDVLVHGDYCLPNVMLENWRLSGLIDVGGSGLGDRHIDLFWGVWSLQFNLKTDAYRARFLDAYGRDKADEEMLRVVAAFEVFG